VAVAVETEMDVGTAVEVGTAEGRGFVVGTTDVLIGGIGVLVAVAVGDGANAHVGTVTLLVSMVTAPFRARARPFTEAPVVSVTLVSVRIDPRKVVPVPSVAELPICM
jgi:hypothetical protein